MVFSVVGLNYNSDRVTIDSTGAAITVPYPASSFLIKCVGGQCYIKRNSSVADGDAYIMDDGESLNLDIRLLFNSDDAVATIGFFKALSVDVTINLLYGY